MLFKCFVFAAFVAFSGAAISAPGLADSEYDPNPQYQYAYDVQDPISGDSKSQVESRNGDVVRGQYSLNDPDGTRRIVDYTADPVNGFNAIVRRTPLTHPVLVRSAYSAPAAFAPAGHFPYSAPQHHGYSIQHY